MFFTVKPIAQYSLRALRLQKNCDVDQPSKYEMQLNSQDKSQGTRCFSVLLTQNSVFCAKAVRQRGSNYYGKN